MSTPMEDWADPYEINAWLDADATPVEERRRMKPAGDLFAMAQTYYDRAETAYAEGRTEAGDALVRAGDALVEEGKRAAKPVRSVPEEQESSTCPWHPEGGCNYAGLERDPVEDAYAQLERAGLGNRRPRPEKPAVEGGPLPWKAGQPKPILPNHHVYVTLKQDWQIDPTILAGGYLTPEQALSIANQLAAQYSTGVVTVTFAPKAGQHGPRNP